MLGVYFTTTQGIQYFEATFSIADSSYGSTFFYRYRVSETSCCWGTVFLLVCRMWLSSGMFRHNHYFGLVAAI